MICVNSDRSTHLSSVVKISYSPPALLEARVLSAYEIEDVKRACIQELRQANPETRNVAATIDEFVQFCALLSRPENHIQVPCGQYIEREVRARQEADMSNEVARKLTELPKYTAYAKIMKEIEGEHIVWKGKIQTLQLKEKWQRKRRRQDARGPAPRQAGRRPGCRRCPCRLA